MSLFIIGSIAMTAAFIIACVTNNVGVSLVLSFWGASLIIHDAITSLKIEEILVKKLIKK